MPVPVEDHGQRTDQHGKDRDGGEEVETKSVPQDVERPFSGGEINKQSQRDTDDAAGDPLIGLYPVTATLGVRVLALQFVTSECQIFRSD